MTSLAILVPVLRRPHRVEPLMASAAAGTEPPHRLLFIAQDNDQAEIDALTAAGADYLVVPASRQSWACKINDGFRVTDHEWILTGADDIEFRPGWFDRALAWADDTTGVIGTNDLWNPRVMQGEHSTHSLVRRSYIEAHGTIDQHGVVLHEGYPHQFADDELVATAKARGMYVHAFDSIVAHLRPHDPRQEDEVYRLGRASHAAGRRLFAQRARLWADAAAVRAAMIEAPERAVVVTACYGGVDTALHAPAPQDMRVDWVCFTDRSDLQAPPPWTVVCEPGKYDDPVMAAKVHKCTPSADATDVVWIDASHEITSPSFVREALAARRDGVAAFIHPRRDCIYSEADASLGAESQGGKYDSQPLLEQVGHYRSEGHPEHGGLWACGVVAWDLADERARAFGADWLAECARWSWQDQLSFPVVARRLGMTPGVFPLDQIDRRLSLRQPYLANRWLRIWPHRTAPAVAASPARREVDSVAVLIPFASSEDDRRRAWQHILDHYQRHHPGWEVVTVDSTGIAPWSKGAALAKLVEQTDARLLVIADADSFVDPDTLRRAVQAVDDGAGWAIPHGKVYRLSKPHTLELYDGAAPSTRKVRRTPYEGVAGGGIVVLTRAAWDTVGGIDARFEGWGGEDISFGWALGTLCGPPERFDAPLFHLWHEQEAQGRHRRGSPANETLAGRYRAASGHPQAMRALIDEAKVPV